MVNHFDYIIVGAGSAGCVLANRLSANSKNSVCLLEAGPSDWNPFIHIPAGFMKTLTNPSVNWLFKAGYTIHRACGKIILTKISILGRPSDLAASI